MALLLLTFILSCGFILCDDRVQQLERLRSQINSLKDARKVYDEKLENLELELRQLRTEREDRSYQQKRGNKGQPIGFSARLNNDLGHLKDDQILIFDHVITNNGNNYNPMTGIFHCDEDGLYAFQLSVVAVPGAYVTTQIARNHQGEAWAFAMDPTNSSSGGALVVMHLQAGDAVYARINGNHHGNEARSITKQYTSFSGFRIQ